MSYSYGFNSNIRKVTLGYYLYRKTILFLKEMIF